MQGNIMVALLQRLAGRARHGFVAGAAVDLLILVAFVQSASIAHASHAANELERSAFDSPSQRAVTSIRCKIDGVTSVHQSGLGDAYYSQPREISRQEWEVRRDGARWRVSEVFRSTSRIGSRERTISFEQLLVVPDAVNGWRVEAKREEPPAGDPRPPYWSIVADSEKELADWAPLEPYLRAGSFIFGYVPADGHQSLREVLEDSTLTLLPDEKVGSQLCRVIRSVGKYGDRTIWLDPAKDLRIVKMQIIRQGNDLSGTEPIASFNGRNADGSMFPKRQLQRLVTLCDGVELEKQGAAWLITKFDWKNQYFYVDDGRMEMNFACRVRDIQLGVPLTAADLTVDKDIPYDTPVMRRNVPGIRHAWRNGEIVRVYLPPAAGGDGELATDGGNAGRMFFIGLNLVVGITVAVLYWRRRQVR